MALASCSAARSSHILSTTSLPLSAFCVNLSAQRRSTSSATLAATAASGAHRMRPLVGPLRVRRVAAALLHLHDPPERGVPGGHPHVAPRRVHVRALDAEHHHVAGARRRGEEAAEEEGERRGPAGDGAHGAEAAGSAVHVAGQRVDVEDVGERAPGCVPRRRVRELAPRCGGDAVPGVAVHVLLRVGDHHGCAVRGETPEGGKGREGASCGCR
nr:unnamed protein product [Digitaria exilis]